MSTISISALGHLREKIPRETEVDLPEPITAFDLVEKHFRIPRTESRMAFIINGKMEKGTYILQPKDSIKVLKMGGAG